MKLIDLPSEIRNAVLQSAMRVMSESADMANMLEKANMLLKHDFPEITASYPSVEQAEELAAKAKWIAEFTKVFEIFWANTGYPRKYWRNTLNGELSTWTSTDGWKETDATSAAKSNISYWEN